MYIANKRLAGRDGNMKKSHKIGVTLSGRGLDMIFLH